MRLKTSSYGSALMVLVLSVTACGDNPFLDRVAEMRGPPEGEVSWPLPDPTFVTLAGDDVNLRSLLGERLTVVNFGGTWCAPCEKELPELQRLHDALSPEGVSVVSVAVSSKHEDLMSWVERYGLTYPLVQGVSTLEWQELKRDLDERGVPLTLVVDAEGTVKYFFRGYRDRVELETLLAPFLADAGVGVETRVGPA